MTETLGIGIGVQTVAPDQLRVNTKSAYDFVYWAGKFISAGVPSDYLDIGPETDGVSLVVWALSQVGVTFPSTYEQAVEHLSASEITTQEAFRTRGALLVCADRISISAGIDNIIDVVNGRHFMYKAVFSPQSPSTCRRTWQYGALVPGLDYK